MEHKSLHDPVFFNAFCKAWAQVESRINECELLERFMGVLMNLSRDSSVFEHMLAYPRQLLLDALALMTRAEAYDAVQNQYKLHRSFCILTEEEEKRFKSIMKEEDDTGLTFSVKYDLGMLNQVFANLYSRIIGPSLHHRLACMTCLAFRNHRKDKNVQLLIEDLSPGYKLNIVDIVDEDPNIRFKSFSNLVLQSEICKLKPETEDKQMKRSYAELINILGIILLTRRNDDDENGENKSLIGYNFALGIIRFALRASHPNAISSILKIYKLVEDETLQQLMSALPGSRAQTAFSNKVIDQYLITNPLTVDDNKHLKRLKDILEHQISDPSAKVCVLSSLGSFLTNIEQFQKESEDMKKFPWSNLFTFTVVYNGFEKQGYSLNVLASYMVWREVNKTLKGTPELSPLFAMEKEPSKIYMIFAVHYINSELEQVTLSSDSTFAELYVTLIGDIIHEYDQVKNGGKKGDILENEISRKKTCLFDATVKTDGTEVKNTVTVITWAHVVANGVFNIKAAQNFIRLFLMARNGVSVKTAEYVASFICKFEAEENFEPLATLLCDKNIFGGRNWEEMGKRKKKHAESNHDTGSDSEDEWEPKKKMNYADFIGLCASVAVKSKLIDRISMLIGVEMRPLPLRFLYESDKVDRMKVLVRAELGDGTHHNPRVSENVSALFAIIETLKLSDANEHTPQVIARYTYEISNGTTSTVAISLMKVTRNLPMNDKDRIYFQKFVPPAPPAPPASETAPAATTLRSKGRTRFGR